MDTWLRQTKRTQTKPISPANPYPGLAHPKRTMKFQQLKKQSQFSRRNNEHKRLANKNLHVKPGPRAPKTKTLFEKTKPISGKVKCA